jgi:hypothetical protein
MDPQLQPGQPDPLEEHAPPPQYREYVLARDGDGNLIRGTDANGKPYIEVVEITDLGVTTHDHPQEQK